MVVIDKASAPLDRESVKVVQLLNTLMLVPQPMLLKLVPGTRVPYEKGGVKQYVWGKYTIYEEDSGLVYAAEIAAYHDSPYTTAWIIAHEYRHHIQKHTRGKVLGDQSEEAEAENFAYMIEAVIRNSKLTRRILANHVEIHALM